MRVPNQAETEFLQTGLDTVECAYYFDVLSATAFNFDALVAQREELRYSPDREPKPIQLGSMEFFLWPYGTPSGYSIILSNRHYRVECSSGMNPSFFVRFSSEGLWSIGLRELHRQFMEWAKEMSLVELQKPGLSRVDFAFDYHLAEIDFDEDAFSSRSRKDSQHRSNGKTQTFTFGKGDIVLRVYDKVAEINEASHKVWFFDLWQRETDVWRVEWQVRKAVLRRFEIRSIEDLTERCGDLLRYLSCEHDKLHVPSMDSNRSRWSLHPLWADLQGRVSNWPGFGVYKAEPTQAIVRERLARIEVSMYGYMKQIAALYSFSSGSDRPELDDTLSRLKDGLNVLHNPFVWNRDVEQRINKIRLGG